MNYNKSTRQRIADINIGIHVSRATAQMTDAAIFNIEGGRVLVNLIVGEVTTELEATGNNTQLQANPDTGTTTDLCANLDTTGKEVGTLFTISGTAGDALQAGSSGSVKGQAVPVVVAAGSIDINVAAAQDGSVKWDIWYVPLDEGAYVEAA